jgi:hypothetical protein
MATLAEIRARIAAQETKTQQKSSGPSDNAIYPFWNIEEGKTAKLRFLPDGNSSNTFFWVERQIIKLQFNGVEGNPNFKQVTVQVPCVEMYGENCPVLAEVRPWYKDETLKEQANKYWKKRSYIFQGFVRQNPLEDDKTPENPIRRFVISPQLIPIIKAGLMDPEILELPTDYLRGLDFNINKTSKGGYADYSTSNWSRRESPLTEVEQAAIETYGLSNLADFLPKKPSETELRIIKEMFEASVEGRPYDPNKWGAYYKPYGLDIGPSTPKSENNKVEESSPVVEDEVEELETSSPVVIPKKTGADNDKAKDILALIRARQAKS